jgi:hypothetical protein
VAVGLPQGVADISLDVIQGDHLVLQYVDVCLPDDDTDFENNVDNDHDGEVLYEYERLREKFFSRNEERLKLLGLSTKEFSFNVKLTKKSKRVSSLKTLPKQGSTRRSVRV